MWPLSARGALRRRRDEVGGRLAQVQGPLAVTCFRGDADERFGAARPDEEPAGLRLDAHPVGRLHVVVGGVDALFDPRHRRRFRFGLDVPSLDGIARHLLDERRERAFLSDEFREAAGRQRAVGTQRLGRPDPRAAWLAAESDLRLACSLGHVHVADGRVGHVDVGLGQVVRHGEAGVDRDRDDLAGRRRVAGEDGQQFVAGDERAVGRRRAEAVGVVTTIAGVTHGEVTVTGDANHAGSTPMTERTDALTTASELVLAVEDAASADDASDTLVGTVGHLDISPGAVNVIPGEVELSLDVRDISADGIEGVVETLTQELSRLEAERGGTTALVREFDQAPTDMSPRLRESVHAAGDRVGVETLDLHSGAFHDTMSIADVTDAALLFAPSRDGISHSPREWTDWEDCATATAVLAEAVASIGGA